MHNDFPEHAKRIFVCSHHGWNSTRINSFTPDTIVDTACDSDANLFVVAFSGSFASIVELEGYETDKAVNWMTAWAVMQGAAFSGMGAGGLAGTDLENGFSIAFE